MTANGSKDAVFRHMDALGITFELIDIDPEFADTAVFCEKYKYPIEQAANTIVVATKKEPKRVAACIVLATGRLDVNKKVRELLGGSRVSFAKSEEMERLTGMQIGGVAPFGLPETMDIFVDSMVMQPSWVIIGTGGRDAKIKVDPREFRKLPRVQIIEDLVRRPTD